jgi:hypothetical protein
LNLMDEKKNAGKTLDHSDAGAGLWNESYTGSQQLHSDFKAGR